MMCFFLLISNFFFFFFLTEMMKVLPPGFARQCRISSDTFGAFDVGNSYIMNIVLVNTCYKKHDGVVEHSECKYLRKQGIEKRLFL